MSVLLTFFLQFLKSIDLPMLTLADSDASLRAACINYVNSLSSYPVASLLFLLEAEVMSHCVRERERVL